MREVNGEERIEELAIEELVAAKRELQLVAERPDARDRAPLHRQAQQMVIAVAEPRATAELLIVGESDAARARWLSLHGEIEGDAVLRAARVQPHGGEALGARETAQALRERVRVHGVGVREAEQTA